MWFDTVRKQTQKKMKDKVKFMAKKNKLLTLVMTAAMALTMALPAFAAEPTVTPRAVYPGTTYTIRGYASTLYATVSGSKVVLSSNSALWTPVNDGGTIKLFVGRGNGSGRVAQYNHGVVSVVTNNSVNNDELSIDFNTISGVYHRAVFDRRNAYWNHNDESGAQISTSWYNESDTHQRWSVTAS